MVGREEVKKWMERFKTLSVSEEKRLTGHLESYKLRAMSESAEEEV